MHVTSLEEVHSYMLSFDRVGMEFVTPHCDIPKVAALLI